MNLKARFGKHLVAVVASMAGGALAGGGIVLAVTSFSPHVPTITSRVDVIASPSPTDSPTPDPSPAQTPSPSPSSAPSAAPTAAPPVQAPATAAPTQAPAAPSCPTGQAVLSMSGTGRWDGTFTVPSECATYTYRWSYGPAPADCRTWTLGFYPDVNGQGHEYTQAGSASGGGSEVDHNPGGRVAAEVNLYNNPGCPAIPWSIAVTAG